MLSAVAFLSVVGRSQPPTERTFRWFPVAGALIGGVVAACWWGTQEVWAIPLAAALTSAADLAITGVLHIDGLADSADGLLPHMERERRLEVMAQPDVGAFAMGTVAVTVLVRWAALASGGVSPWSIVAVWCLSRTLAAAVPSFVSYARPDGLAAPFLGTGSGSNRWLVLVVVPATAALIAAQQLRGGIAAVALVVTTVGVITLARRRLGGFTGDVLGASIVLSETAALVALAAR